jgi:hypothetical protein
LTMKSSASRASFFDGSFLDIALSSFCFNLLMSILCK